MSDVKLGQLVEGTPGRDAIHLAVIPAIAGELLAPGYAVGLINGKAYCSNKSVGIVDPFLRVSVNAGEKFWLCLYQFTVTGMRHCWSHPEFSDELPKRDQKHAASIEYIGDVAAECDMAYKELMDGAAKWIESECQEQIDGNCTLTDEFWQHYENITGKRGTGQPFNCQC